MNAGQDLGVRVTGGGQGIGNVGGDRLHGRAARVGRSDGHPNAIGLVLGNVLQNAKPPDAHNRYFRVLHRIQQGPQVRHF